MFEDASSFNQDISAWQPSPEITEARDDYNTEVGYLDFSAGTCPLLEAYHPNWYWYL
ncbi:MAG: hypothetical protein RL385_4713 [Pseudomonadota bacterium]